MQGSFLKPAQIEWVDPGTPFSSQYGDIYHSKQGGEEQALSVFLRGNRLPERWEGCGYFRIGEVGFGSGLNFAVTLREWKRFRPNQSRLDYLAFEKHPLRLSDLKKALSANLATDDLRPLFEYYPPHVKGSYRICFLGSSVRLTLLWGDALETLSNFRSLPCVDAWYLDGFSPAKNPMLWSAELFSHLARLSSRDATIGTYSVAASVRQALSVAGFTVQKETGFGNKRQSLSGVRSQVVSSELPKSQEPWFDLSTPALSFPRTATVIGGGLAGSLAACALAERGIEVCLLERESALAQGASGNPLGILMPFLAAEPDPKCRLLWSSFIYASSYLTHGLSLKPYRLGVLKLSDPHHSLTQLKRACDRHGDSPHLVKWVEQIGNLQEQTGIGFDATGAFFPNASVHSPLEVCERAIQRGADRIRLKLHSQAIRLEYQGDHWMIRDLQDQILSQSEIAVICNAADALQFKQSAHLPLKSVRGQITWMDSIEAVRQLKVSLVGDYYLLPEHNGRHIVGASYSRTEASREVSAEENAKMLSYFTKTIPGLEELSPGQHGRVSFRAYTPDAMPIVGQAPDPQAYLQAYHDLKKGYPRDRYPKGSYFPGLYFSLAHGSRGLASAAFAGEWIANQICGEQPLLPLELQHAIHPGRFLIRNLLAT